MLSLSLSLPPPARTREQSVCSAVVVGVYCRTSGPIFHFTCLSLPSIAAAMLPAAAGVTASKCFHFYWHLLRYRARFRIEMRVAVFPGIEKSLEKELNYNYCTVAFTRGTLEFQIITFSAFSDNLTLSDCLGGFTAPTFLQQHYLMQLASTKGWKK